MAGKKTTRSKKASGTEKWNQRLLWIIIAAVISVAFAVLFEFLTNSIGSTQSVVKKRAGMWYADNAHAHMLIPGKAGKRIAVFWEVEGFWVEINSYSNNRWHGTWNCNNTGTASGLVVIDDSDNGLKMVVDLKSGQQLVFDFKTVESGKPSGEKIGHAVHNRDFGDKSKTM